MDDVKFAHLYATNKYELPAGVEYKQYTLTIRDDSNIALATILNTFYVNSKVEARKIASQCNATAWNY